MIDEEVDRRVCSLAKNISDFVGNSSSEKYFRELITAANRWLDTAYGFVLSVNSSTDGDCKVLVNSIKDDQGFIDNDIVQMSLINKLLNDNNESIVINLTELDYDNPLSIVHILSFPLHDENYRVIGLLVFASTKELEDEEVVVSAIKTQIPRAVAELDRLQIKSRLNLFEKNYNNLIDSTLDVVWEADKDGYVKAITGSCNSVYGYPEINMMGKCYSDFMSKASAVRFFEQLSLIMHGESLYEQMSDHITKDDKLIRVSSNMMPKYDNNNNIIGVIGITKDISASVRAQMMIKNNSELFSSILSRLPVIFFRVDHNGYLIDIRGNGLKRMGVEDMDWVGKPGYGLFLGMDEKINSALSGNTVFFENKGTFKGVPWWFYTSMFFDSWSGFGAVGFSVDITDQKYVEEQLVELLKNNRKLAQKLVAVQEDERRNLARELHDELGQSITAVKSLATAISSSVGNQYTEVRSLSNSIVDLSGRLYEVVNNIMQRLRPDIIDSMDFNETIKNCIVRSQLETVGVNCHLSITGNIKNLEEVVKVTIYRIVQECLTNVSKHAMASNVTINIQRGMHELNLGCKNIIDAVQVDHSDMRPAHKRDTIKIEISDDGVGLGDDNGLQSSKHIKRHGLLGIQERVTALGGTLLISGKRRKGVKIQAVLMLDDINHDLSQKAENSASTLNGQSVESPDVIKVNTH